MTQAEQITEIAVTVARIEATIKEGVIKRLDTLNGTQKQQWTKINRNTEDQVELRTRLADHCDNPGVHGERPDDDSEVVDAARIQASSARGVAVIVGVTSIVTSFLTAGVTLLIGYLF